MAAVQSVSIHSDVPAMSTIEDYQIHQTSDILPTYQKSFVNQTNDISPTYQNSFVDQTTDILPTYQKSFVDQTNDISTTDHTPQTSDISSTYQEPKMNQPSKRNKRSRTHKKTKTHEKVMTIRTLPDHPIPQTMWETVWDDINDEEPFVPIMNPVDITFPFYISNVMYDILYTDGTLNALMNTKKINIPINMSNVNVHHYHKQYPIDINKYHKIFRLARKEMLKLPTSRTFMFHIHMLIQEEYRRNITITDYLFINSYYRRILRAQLELLYNTDKAKVLSFINACNYFDRYVKQTMILTLNCIGILCRYLGIPNTCTCTSFPKKKLYMPTFWNDISHKFLKIFGEETMKMLDISGDMELSKYLHILLAFNVLKTILYIWNGTIVELKEKTVHVYPSYVVNRLTNYVRPF